MEKEHLLIIPRLMSGTENTSSGAKVTVGQTGMLQNLLYENTSEIMQYCCLLPTPHVPLIPHIHTPWVIAQGK